MTPRSCQHERLQAVISRRGRNERMRTRISPGRPRKWVPMLEKWGKGSEVSCNVYFGCLRCRKAVLYGGGLMIADSYEILYISGTTRGLGT